MVYHFQQPAWRKKKKMGFFLIGGNCAKFEKESQV